MQILTLAKSTRQKRFSFREKISKMGRKALVDYSLIKEICENLRRSKNKFKGQLELDPENGSPKEGKKVKEIKSRMDSSRGPVEQDNSRGRRGQRPVTSHQLKRELQRLEREFEQGRHTGKNEKKVMKRMKEISSNWSPADIEYKTPFPHLQRGWTGGPGRQGAL